MSREVQDIKVSTLSIVVGNSGCNGTCPYCVSRMSPDFGHPSDINWRNFGKACRLAEVKGVTTVLLTGKGEPTLHPELVNSYLKAIARHSFPFIDLQTNGIFLDVVRRDGSAYGDRINRNTIAYWHEMGVSTVAVSMAHYDNKINASVCQSSAPERDQTNLGALVAFLHDMRFSVRLCCVVMNGYIDKPEEVDNLVKFARSNSVEQLTLRPIGKPVKSKDPEGLEWVAHHELTVEEKKAIDDHVAEKGQYLMTPPHGADVFDIEGQNICLSDCLPRERPPGSSIQIIFWPNGSIRYDWQFEGAVLL